MEAGWKLPLLPLVRSLICRVRFRGSSVGKNHGNKWKGWKLPLLSSWKVPLLQYTLFTPAMETSTGVHGRSGSSHYFPMDPSTTSILPCKLPPPPRKLPWKRCKLPWKYTNAVEAPTTSMEAYTTSPEASPSLP